MGAVCGTVALFNFIFNLNNIDNEEFLGNMLFLVTKVASAIGGWTGALYTAIAICSALDIATTGGLGTAIVIIATALGSFVGLLLMSYIIDLGKCLIKGEEIKFNHWDNFCLAASGFVVAALWTTSFTVLPALIMAALPVTTLVCNIICSSIAAFASTLFFTIGLAPRKEKAEFEMQEKKETEPKPLIRIYQDQNVNPAGDIPKTQLVEGKVAPRPIFSSLIPSLIS